MFSISCLFYGFDMCRKIRLVADLLKYGITKPYKENWTQQIVDEYFNTFVQMNFFSKILPYCYNLPK